MKYKVIREGQKYPVISGQVDANTLPTGVDYINYILERIFLIERAGVGDIFELEDGRRFRIDEIRAGLMTKMAFTEVDRVEGMAETDELVIYDGYVERECSISFVNKYNDSNEPMLRSKRAKKIVDFLERRLSAPLYKSIFMEFLTRELKDNSLFKKELIRSIERSD